MGSLYYDLKGILERAGLTVVVNDINKGWERRARSSGGFSSPPLCVFWHHTASSSSTSANSDLSYMIKGNPDAPVGNLLIGRDGVCYPIAGGASNCAGKGRAMSFSRGTGNADNGNTWGFQIECQNNGVGEPWSKALVDSLMTASNALNAEVGNLPTDITSHALGAGDGYTDRKIDPSQAAVVQGPWKPRSTNSSGTWSLADMRNEAMARCVTPTPDGDDDMNGVAFCWVDPNRCDAFAVGTDKAMWHNWWALDNQTADGWGGWHTLGGGFTGSPWVTAFPWDQWDYSYGGPPRIDVWGRGGDGKIWQNTWTGREWVGWSCQLDWPGG